MITRAMSKSMLRGCQVLSRKVSFQTPLTQNFSRPFSTLFDKIVCQCGAELPKAETIVDLYKQRNLREINQMVNCKQFKSFDFVHRENCELSKELERISALVLPLFDDIVYLDNERYVMLESLKTIPKENLGDLTGDHGKQVSKFIKKCLQKELISNIGSIVDVGGQNTSTVELISETLGNTNLPSLIVDLSTATPAITASRPNTKYAIGDAYLFFSSERYQDSIKNVINDDSTLVLFNNILNVLKPEDGWKTLQAAWSRLRPGDYLFISGLVPEQLEAYGIKKYRELDGIIEFHHSQGFYKSALLPEFSNFIEIRLKNSSILIKETFEQIIEAKQLNLIEVQGYRLLALMKV